MRLKHLHRACVKAQHAVYVTRYNDKLDIILAKGTVTCNTSSSTLYARVIYRGNISFFNSIYIFFAYGRGDVGTWGRIYLLLFVRKTVFVHTVVVRACSYLFVKLYMTMFVRSITADRSLLKPKIK